MIPNDSNKKGRYGKLTSSGNLIRSIDGGQHLIRSQLPDPKKEDGSNHLYRSIIVAGSGDIPNSYTPKESGERVMDESTKMMLERLERDSREREQRYHADAQEREKRYREDQHQLLTAINSMKTELKQEMSSIKQEMKADFTEFKQEIKSDIKHFDSKLASLDTKIDGTYKHISSITIATIVGIGACVLTIGSVAVTIWLTR